MCEDLRRVRRALCAVKKSSSYDGRDYNSYFCHAKIFSHSFRFFVLQPDFRDNARDELALERLPSIPITLLPFHFPFNL